ncbi:MAG: RebB family R body protein [Magnetospirillum sp. WYHS-4]
MSVPNIVQPQVTDAVTQANVTTLGNGAAVSTTQSILALSQAQGTLFANMVGGQQSQAIAALATVMRGVEQTLGGGGNEADAGMRQALVSINKTIENVAAQSAASRDFLKKIEGVAESISMKIK